MTKLARLKTVYKIFATEFKGPPTLLATIDGEEVTGEFTTGIKDHLLEKGWPKIPPNEIFNNGYVFTQIVRVPAGL